MEVKLIEVKLIIEGSLKENPKGQKTSIDLA